MPAGSTLFGDGAAGRAQWLLRLSQHRRRHEQLIRREAAAPSSQMAEDETALRAHFRPQPPLSSTSSLLARRRRAVHGRGDDHVLLPRVRRREHGDADAAGGGRGAAHRVRTCSQRRCSSWPAHPATPRSMAGGYGLWFWTNVATSRHGNSTGVPDDDDGVIFLHFDNDVFSRAGGALV